MRILPQFGSFRLHAAPTRPRKGFGVKNRGELPHGGSPFVGEDGHGPDVSRRDAESTEYGGG